MSEAVKVIVRCRPFNNREKSLSCENVVNMDQSRASVALQNPQEKNSPSKQFTYDAVYYMDSTAEQIYSDVALPLVESVTEGYNGTIFAYGQTGCGKTFTMQGIKDPPAQRGIIPRAFDHIFETISVAENTKFLIHSAYIEIYKEEIRDLLGKDPKQKLDLKEHPQKGVYVAGLSMHPVHNVKDCEKVMDRGFKNRQTGETLMNKESSRSHSIFTIFLEMSKEDSSGKGKDGKDLIRAGKLNLVDLAGSERQAKTGASGNRLKEATKINLSLSALGNVISALVDGKSKHIPYRDSKLTRLLQDSLGGNTKTLMVACISPASDNYDESLSTLRYANRAKNIKNKPKINEDPKDTLLRQYQEEIEKLKSMLVGQPGGASPATAADPAEQKKLMDQQIEAEREKMRKEFEAQMLDIKSQYESEKGQSSKLKEDVKTLEKDYKLKMKEMEKKVERSMKENEQHRAKMQGVPGSNGAVLPLTMKAIQQDEALKRLQELQEQFVGGEKANDEKLKKKHREKLTHAEKVRLRIAETIAKTDDDGIMMRVYDNMQDELKAKNDLLKRAKEKIKSLEAEITDVQSEFEFDRIDYLDTIRRQDQQMKLLEQILERVQPLVRRDCNYSNVDNIRQNASWLEDGQQWQIPEVAIDKTNLPQAGVGGGKAGRKGGSSVMNGPMPGLKSPSVYNTNGFAPHSEMNGDDDRFRQVLEHSDADQRANDYFKQKRDVLSVYRNDANRLSGPGGRSGTSLQGSSALIAPTGGGFFGEAKPARLDPLADMTNRRKAYTYH